MSLPARVPNPNPFLPPGWTNQQFPRDCRMKRRLGRGHDGTVYLYKHTPSSTYFAVKCLRERINPYHPPNEITVLRSLPQHPNIVNLKSVFTNAPKPGVDCIVYEACLDRDLRRLHSRKQSIDKGIYSEHFLWSIFTQLCSALAFLHEGIGSPIPPPHSRWNPVIHRDITLRNILVYQHDLNRPWAEIRIKLADFGFSSYYQMPNDPFGNRKVGSPIQWPPEQTWNNPNATLAGDVWALGSVIHELAHGFGATADPDVFHKTFTSSMWGREMLSQVPVASREQFMAATLPRQTLPVNLGEGEQPEDSRRLRKTMRYSDGLNGCLMAALEWVVPERATAGRLLRSVVDEHRTFLKAEENA